MTELNNHEIRNNLNNNNTAKCLEQEADLLKKFTNQRLAGLNNGCVKNGYLQITKDRKTGNGRISVTEHPVHPSHPVWNGATAAVHVELPQRYRKHIKAGQRTTTQDRLPKQLSSMNDDVTLVVSPNVTTNAEQQSDHTQRLVKLDEETTLEDCEARPVDLSRAMEWIKQEITEMKEQDRSMMRKFLDLRATINHLRGYHQMDGSLSLLHHRPTSQSTKELWTWGGSLSSLSDNSSGSGIAPAGECDCLQRSGEDHRLLSPLLQTRTQSMQSVLHATPATGVGSPLVKKRTMRLSLHQANSMDVLL